VHVFIKDVTGPKASHTQLAVPTEKEKVASLLPLTTSALSFLNRNSLLEKKLVSFLGEFQSTGNYCKKIESFKAQETTVKKTKGKKR